MKFRNAILAMEGYKTAKQAPYAIGVASNENNYGPSPKALAALQRITPQQMLRYPDPAATGLRKAIAMYAAVPEENVVCFSGGDEAIRTILGMFLEPGKALAGHAPTFAMYPLNAQFYGSDYRATRLSDEFEFGQRQKEELIKTMDDEATACVALCNPNNPTGNAIPKETMREIIGAALEKDLPVVVDEAYFEFNGETVAAQAADGDSNVIVVRTLSKAFGLAGLRVGYAIVPAPAVEQLMKIKPVFNVNAAAQTAAVAAVEDVAFMRQNVAKITTCRERMTKQLGDMGLKAFPSRANFLLFECPEGFVEKLAEKGILARAFQLEGWGAGSYCRLSVGTREENEKVLQAIGEMA